MKTRKNKNATNQYQTSFNFEWSSVSENILNIDKKNKQAKILSFSDALHQKKSYRKKMVINAFLNHAKQLDW